MPFCLLRRFVFALDAQLDRGGDKRPLTHGQREELGGQQVEFVETIVSKIRFTVAPLD